MDYTTNVDVVVLGAGISGLVTASSILAQPGRDPLSSILVLDEFPEPGGNHLSVNVADYTFDIGSFFFADNAPFLRHFPELLSFYENNSTGTYRIARINPAYALARYPYDFRKDIGPGQLPGVILSALRGRMFTDPSKSADDFVRHWIGRRFFTRSGLDNYIQRFYGVPAKRIEGVFASKRMTWVSDNAKVGRVVRRILSRQKTGPAGPKQLVRPKAGFGTLYRAAQSLLELRGVAFDMGIRLSSITREGEALVIALSDGRRIRTRQIFSTIPLSRMLELTGLPRNDLIRTKDMRTLFLSFEGNRGFAANVLYNFAREGLWKRLTMHSDFYGKVQGREYFSVEVTLPAGDIPAEELLADFRAVTGRAGLFAGKLRLEGSALTENAYPVYLEGASAAADLEIDRLKDMGILSYGRQGGFDYQPIAVISARKAEDMVRDHLVTDPDPEWTSDGPQVFELPSGVEERSAEAS